MEVTFEQAKALKELGFVQDESTAGYDKNGNIVHHCGSYCLYHGCDNNPDDTYFGKLIYAAPTQDEVAKWFRDEKGIQIVLRYGGCTWWSEVQEGLRNINRSKNLERYEEALSSGIDYAIEYLRCKISKDELIGLLNSKSNERTELLKKLEELETEISNIEGQLNEK